MFPFLQVHPVSQPRPSQQYTDFLAVLEGPACSMVVGSPKDNHDYVKNTDSYKHTDQKMYNINKYLEGIMYSFLEACSAKKMLLFLSLFLGALNSNKSLLGFLFEKQTIHLP